MANIKDLRSRYPQYDDMSDQEFAQAFHGKFYSDMSFNDFAQKIGLAPSSAPAGYELVQEFDDGGRIVRSASGRESYMADGYATSDPAIIAEIKASGGRAGDISRRSYARDIIDQTGELVARGASALKGVVGAGSWLDEIVGKMGGEDAASAMRAAQEAREIVAPKTVMASRIGTGLASSIPVAMAAPSVGGALGVRAAAGALGGATEGMIYGMGDENRGNFNERVSGGLTPAAIGGAIGGAIPLAGGAVGGLIGSRVAKPAREIAEEIGVKEGALDLLSAAAQMDAPVSQERMSRAGQYASLGMSGPATQNLLDLAASSTSSGAAIARKNIDEVAGEAAGQFNRLLNSTLGDPVAAGQQIDELMSGTSPIRKELYDAAYDAAIDYSGAAGRNLEDALSAVDPSVISRAERLMRLERQPSRQIKITFSDAGEPIFETMPDVRQIDYITRALNSVALGDDPAEALASRGAAADIRKALDELVPEYGAARAAAADTISLRNAIELGTQLMNPKTTRYDVKRAVDGMGDVELSALRQGLRSQIDEIMANTKSALTDPAQDVREVIRPLKEMTSGAGSEKLGIILGDQADDFMRQLDEVYSVMAMRASVAQNSKTAIRKMAREVAMDRIDPTFAQMAGERGLPTAITEVIRRQVSTAPSREKAFQELMGEVALPLTRQSDVSDLARQIEALRRAAPQIEQGRSIYEAGKRYGSSGAIAGAPAIQGLLGVR